MVTKKSSKSKKTQTKPQKAAPSQKPFRQTVKESIIAAVIILVCGCALAIGAYLIFAPR